MVGAQFSRVRPSKNRSGEWLRTASARKSDKNRFRRRLRTHFFGSGPVFSRFWGPGRVPKSSQNCPLKKQDRRLFGSASCFFAFLSLGCVPDGSRTHSGDTRDRPGPDFDRIFGCLLAGSMRVLAEVCWVPPGSFSRSFSNEWLTSRGGSRPIASGILVLMIATVVIITSIILLAIFACSAGMSPGSASNLSNPLCGVPLGYGDLAQRFKFAVPHRGAGVSNPVRSPTILGGASPPDLPARLGETVEPSA